MAENQYQGSLIIVAHGSRIEASNQKVRQLTERVSEKIDNHFLNISCAFLELAEPDIPAAIEADMELGVKMITILPFFLSAGTHITGDIPEIIQQKRIAHPEISLHIAPYIGELDGMVPLIISAIEMIDTIK